MPTAVEMETTVVRIFYQFGLDDFALGLDGCVIRFEDQPHGLLASSALLEPKPICPICLE